MRLKHIKGNQTFAPIKTVGTLVYCKHLTTYTGRDSHYS